MLVDVTSVTVLDSHRLKLQFSDGYTGILDMVEKFNRRPFNQLANPELFATATVGYGTVVWDGGRIDIAPETAREEATPLP